MKLTDILPVEKWVELEREIHEKYGLDSNIFDIDGIRISDFKEWVNRLCPAIKATDKGQSYICAVAHMNVAAQAKQQKKPVIEECDAGLIKLVVPIFAMGEFVGAAGACGLLLDDGEVDSFMINKTTEIEEDRINDLSNDVNAISTERAEEIADFIKTRIEEITKNFEEQDK